MQSIRLSGFKKDLHKGEKDNVFYQAIQPDWIMFVLVGKKNMLFIQMWIKSRRSLLNWWLYIIDRDDVFILRW